MVHTNLNAVHWYTNIRLIVAFNTWAFFFRIAFKLKFFLKTFFLKKKKFKSWKIFFLKTLNDSQWSAISLSFQKKNFTLFLKKKQATFFLKTTHDAKLLIAKTQFTSIKKDKVSTSNRPTKRICTQFYNNRSTSISALRNFKKLYTSLKDCRSLFIKGFKTNFFERNKRLTKILKPLITQQTNVLLNQLEFSVNSVLLKSKLVLSASQLHELISFNCIFMNSKTVARTTTLVRPGSKIQIIPLKSYLVYYLYSYNLNLKWVYRTGYCLWRFYRHKFNLFKQSPKKLPNWLTRLVFYKQELPSYVEVDFTILTTCVISTPCQRDRLINKIYSTNFNRLLNWKYVI